MDSALQSEDSTLLRGIELGIPTLSTPPRYQFTKRILDAILASIGLLLASPLWLFISIAITLDDGQPIFYFQKRVGLGGRIFSLIKFRTMVKDAEKESGPIFSHAADTRVTRIGKFLRTTAMDELPQLINILKGDISFVGPRAERPEFVERFAKRIPSYTNRLAVRPGLTGIAQVYGHYNSHAQHKLRYDMIYLEQASFWLDIKLIIQSLWITIRGKWMAHSKER